MEAEMKTKDCCSYCHIAFSLAEKRVISEFGVEHVDCLKKRTRKARIHEFFLTERGKGIIVIPKHRF